MITAVEFPDKYSFIGNPMLVKISADSYSEIVLSIGIESVTVIDVSVYLFGKDGLYTGTFDVSKILGSFLKKYSISKSGIISKVENFELNYWIDSKDYNGFIFNGKAFFGGISNTNYSRLKSIGLNMFSYRLKNFERQFFFTTRTNSNQIVVKETELHPFLFIHPGKPIKVITPTGKSLIFEAFPEGTICSLDIALLRKSIYTAYNELSSLFIFEVEGIQCIRLIITNNVIGKNCYILKFRNSLGAYEYLEVTGDGTQNYSFGEDDSWLTLTEDNYFEERRSRIATQKQISIEAGYKSQNELLFIIDLIKSDDIYFIDSKDYQLREYPCLIKTEEIKIPLQITEPSSINLTLRFTTNEIFESPEILFDYVPSSLFRNITADGRPQIDGFGFIYDQDYPFHAE